MSANTAWVRVPTYFGLYRQEAGANYIGQYRLGAGANARRPIPPGCGCQTVAATSLVRSPCLRTWSVGGTSGRLQCICSHKPISAIPPGCGRQLSRPIPPGCGCQPTSAIPPGCGCQLFRPIPPGCGCQRLSANTAWVRVPPVSRLFRGCKQVCSHAFVACSGQITLSRRCP